MSAPDPSGGAGAALDPDAKFTTVVSCLEEWQHGGENQFAAPQRLRQYLDARLNADSESPWERDVVERRRGSQAADVVVNGEIGVKLVQSVRPSMVTDLRVALDLLGDQYNYVAVYWVEATASTADRRRTIERKTAASRFGLREVAFVTAERDTGTTVEGTGERLTLDLRVVAAAAALAMLSVGLVARGAAEVGGLGVVLLAGAGGLFLGTFALGVFLARA